MIIGCFRGCFSLKADTKFEKARLQATYNGDYEPPSESDIQQVLKTLAGNDEETRPDVAFSLLQSKMQYSESKNIWNYIVKNLVLLDRCVEDRSFVSDIATIHIIHVENYKDPDPKNNIIKIDTFIKKYFQYIKMKSKLYAKKNSSFNVSKAEKRKFFRSLTTEKLFSEMSEAAALFTFSIDLAKTNTDPLNRVSKRGYLEYKINQYVFHLMLYTMMNLYISMFTIIAVTLERLSECNLEEVEKVKFYYMQFLKHSELFSQFINDHRFIKGYEEIKVNEFYQPNRNAIQLINDMIAILKNRNNQLDKDAITMKLDEGVLTEKIVIELNNNYNKRKYQDNNYDAIQSSQYNQLYTSNNFALDSQEQNYNGREPYRYELGESQRLSDPDQFISFKEGAPTFLESSKEGFDCEYFKLYQNEYSEFSHKKTGQFTIKIQKQQPYSLNKSNLLEQYFINSFQSSVSFMISDKYSQYDCQLKAAPNFNIVLFQSFQNDYSVQKITLYSGPDETLQLSNKFRQNHVQKVIESKENDDESTANNGFKQQIQKELDKIKNYETNNTNNHADHNQHHNVNNYQFVKELIDSQNITESISSSSISNNQNTCSNLDDSSNIHDNLQIKHVQSVIEHTNS